MSFYLFAETAFHHEGNKEYLLKLVDAAKNAGADGVKFQVLFDLSEFMSSSHSAFSEAQKWILSENDWREVFNYTKQLGLDIILMPLDTKAFTLIKDYEIRFLEIHSVSFKDQLLLELLNTTTIPLIFGIGGRTFEEIDTVVQRFKDRELTLMTGFQSFPTALKDAKLSKIRDLSLLYPNCFIGYADHSSFDDEMAVKSTEYAYLLGARVFEKHLTIDEGKERIDFQSAIGIQNFALIRNKLEYLEDILSTNGESIFKLNEKEIIYRNRQKVPVALKNIEEGEQITKDMLGLKMVDVQGNIQTVEELVDRVVNKKVLADHPLFFEDLI